MRTNEVDGCGNGHGRAVVASHAIYRELYCHGVRRISCALHGTTVSAKAPTAIDTKKRQMNAAFLPSRENVKRADRHAKRQGRNAVRRLVVLRLDDFLAAIVAVQ